MHVVTGGTGRLGAHLIKELINKGKRVKALVRTEEDKKKLPEGAVPHVGDVTDQKSLEGLVGKGDTVFHLAGVIKESTPDEVFHRVNLLGTENLLNSCMGKDVARFVFVSSISVFGNLEYLPGDEGCEKKPVTKYGRSKMLAEEAVVRKWKQVPATIIRPGMIYGPGFDEGYVQVLKMLSKGKMCVIGDGENRIPLIHVSDAVDALVLASESEEAVRRDFVIAGPGSPTQAELLKIASSALGVAPPRRSVPVWLAEMLLPFARLLGKASLSRENLGQFTRDRPFDCTKAKKAFGFAPKTPLSQGIKEVVEHYREQKVIP